MRGRVRRDERAPSGFELTVAAVEVVQNPAEDYPIAKKEHGIDFLLENRHLWLRSSRPARDHAHPRPGDHVLPALLPRARASSSSTRPILTGSIGESAGTLFDGPLLRPRHAYLAQTGQLYLEAACMAYGRVYNFGPTFRAEKSKTRRHLTEFWMLEAEVAYADNEDNMRLQERMVSAVVAAVLQDHRDDLAALERDTAPLEEGHRAVRPAGLRRGGEDPAGEGQRHPVGRRPRRRGRDHPHEDARASRSS